MGNNSAKGRHGSGDEAAPPMLTASSRYAEADLFEPTQRVICSSLHSFTKVLSNLSFSSLSIYRIKTMLTFVMFFLYIIFYIFTFLIYFK